MLKFKREDLGLYFALGLVGAGTGLLVGAFIASRRGGLVPVNIPPMEPAMEVTVKKIPRKKFSEKKGKKELTPEMKAFIDKYEPTKIQIEMVKNGYLTLESLEETMIKEELAKHKPPVGYYKRYLEDEEKPDLEELALLPDDLEMVDDRYKILEGPHPGKPVKSLRVVYFDPEDESFFTMTRRKDLIPADSVEEFISEETWDVMLPYMLSGFAPLYVDDMQTARHYRFELVPEESEESSENDDTQ
jgi:hypothetical protein